MTVIVTGSRGLIGRGITRFLRKDLGEVVIEVDTVLGNNLTDQGFVKEFFKEHHAAHLINLFAFNDHVRRGEKRSTLFDITLESFRHCMDVNVTALFSVCREYARNNEKGNIINFGASTGITSPRTDMYNGSHKHVGYSVSKAGVIHLSKVLAVHLAPNIRVNCVSPGGMEHEQSEEFKDLYGSHTPMGRMGRVEELFPVIRMLCDSENSYMTGANIVIDGGWTIL